MRFVKIGRKALNEQKLKAATFLKLAEKMGAKGIVHQTMKRSWYRHIDKAIAGKTTKKDAKHWKRMRKTFKRETVGVPTEETRELYAWLEEFEKRVKREEINQTDVGYWLPHFRSYMEDCEASAIDNYIIKNKLLEVEE